MSVSSSGQRILSLWLCRLSTDRLARLSPEAPKGVVIYGKRGNAEIIVALDATAEGLGLSKGLALAQARAMHPALVAIEEDVIADAGQLDAVAEWCLRYTPLVACDTSDSLLLDITGCAHLYGGERALSEDLRVRLARAKLCARFAVAGTIGTAFALARFEQAGIHPNGEERAQLSPLPLAALRIPADVIAALSRVGLKRIGDIVDLPRAPLAARFGVDLLRQLDRALGHEHEPLNPRLPVAPYVAEQRFAEPIMLEEHVLETVERLAGRLRPALERRGDGARRLELALFRTDGALRRVSAGTSQPLRNPQEIRVLFTQRLTALADEYDPGFGFDMARLSVVVAEPCPEQQTGLNDDHDAAALDRLIDCLSARLGAHRVRRPVASDSHAIEATAATLPAQIKDRGHGWDAFRRHRTDHGLGPRPLRLLIKPEPIEALAQVPDGPPLRFRWRRALHNLVAAEGPERIEGAWWKEADEPARDYFRIEDESGLRFWVFRAGLYRKLSQEDWDKGRFPQWFMHGIFA